MKKIFSSIVLILNLLCFSIAFSQTQLPQVVPVSPEAASLGKYGEIPVNLATGKINYTVPIYTIDVNGFQWPIYLSYNYNGLMVEQDPPLTGLGWDLMATGRITRQIRGKPDDREAYANLQYKKNVIVPYLEWDYSISDYPLSDLYNLYRNIETKTLDGQNDKYYINAGNLSGSYVYNEDNEVVFLNYRNYKIDGTIITDEGGVKYYFEQSESGDFHINTPEGGTLNEPIPISYLLTKIELPNNKGIINFEYYPIIDYDKTVVSETEVISLAFPNEINIDPVVKTVRSTPIKKITFPNGEVRFGVTTANDNGIQTSSLNNISVWNNNSETLNYNFNYSNSAKSLKTLNSIQKNRNNIVLPWYSFEYYSFPNSLDYKQQDIWGFYNGKPNANLINGDREVVFNKTVSGALKNINYPTGGSTEVTYEQNKIVSYASNSNGDCTYSHNKTISGQLIGDSNPKFIDTIITLPSNQIVTINAYARVGNGSATNMFGAEASIEIKTIGYLGCLPNSVNVNIAVYGEEQGVCSYGDPFNPCPPPDLYTENDSKTRFVSDAKIYIRGSVEAPQGKEAKIYYVIHYEDRINEDKNIGGVRVAQTKDCSKPNDCITTDYKYINTDNTSSGYLLGADAIFNYSIFYSELGKAGNKYYRSSNSMQNFNSFQSAPVLYDRVELLKSGGDNGKIVKHFSKFGNQGVSALPFLEKENKDWKSGKLLKTEIFRKQNGQFDLQRVEENFYDEFFSYGKNNNSLLKAYNFDVARIKYLYSLLSDGTLLLTESVYNYRERSTIDYPKAYLQTKSTTKEYFPSGEIETETTYEYNSPRLLLHKKKSIVNGGKIIETTTLYPDDIKTVSTLQDDSTIDGGALSSNEFNAIKKLQKSTATNTTGQNRIAEPIQVETIVKNGSTVVSKTVQRTNYKDWGNDIVLPKDVQTLKGTYNSSTNKPQDRLVFHDYYPNNGNVKEVSKKDGTHMVYIWGYNEQYPIAKIENATYSQVSSALGITNLNLLKGNTLTDQQVRDKLTILRNHSSMKSAQVTGYTYNPLIGVSSITDPTDQTIYYYYDSFNRLEFVKDAQGKILSKNEYNYKN